MRLILLRLLSKRNPSSLSLDGNSACNFTELSTIHFWRARRCGDFGFFEFVEYLGCHLIGDWGDLCPDDKDLNDEAIATEQRGETTDSLFSMYRHTDGTEIYIVTDEISPRTVNIPEGKMSGAYSS